MGTATYNAATAHARASMRQLAAESTRAAALGCVSALAVARTPSRARGGDCRRHDGSLIASRQIRKKARTPKVTEDPQREPRKRRRPCGRRLQAWSCQRPAETHAHTPPSPAARMFRTKQQCGGTQRYPSSALHNAWYTRRPCEQHCGGARAGRSARAATRTAPRTHAATTHARREPPSGALRGVGGRGQLEKREQAKEQREQGRHHRGRARDVGRGQCRTWRRGHRGRARDVGLGQCRTWCRGLNARDAETSTAVRSLDAAARLPAALAGAVNVPDANALLVVVTADRPHGARHQGHQEQRHSARHRTRESADAVNPLWHSGWVCPRFGWP